MNNKEFLFRSVKAVFVRGLGAISLFIMNFVVAKNLTIYEAGYFLLSFTVISIISVVTLWGMDQCCIRFVSAYVATNKDCKAKGVANGSRFIVLVSGIFSSILLWFFASFLAIDIFSEPPMLETLKIMALSLPFAACGILLSAQLQAIGWVSSSILILYVLNPLFTSLLILLFDLNTSLDVAYAFLFSCIASFAIGIVMTKYAYKGMPKSEPVIYDHLKSAFSFWVVSVMTMSVLWGGQFIAGLWVSAEEIAFLAIAQRTANLISFLLIAVNLVVAPRFSALYSQGRYVELELLSKNTVKLMSVFALPVFLFVFIFAENIMSVFGDEYISASSMLLVLSVGQLVNVLSGSVAFLLTMSGGEKDMANVVLVSGLAALIFPLCLVPTFGVLGAAVGTAIAVSIQNIGAVYFVYKKLGFNILFFWKTPA